MKITKTITIDLTDEEVLDFAINDLMYSPLLKRVNEDTGEIEEYKNPVSVEDLVNQAVNKTLENAIRNSLGGYMQRKKEQALADAKASYDAATVQATTSLLARQAEAIQIS